MVEAQPHFIRSPSSPCPPHCMCEKLLHRSVKFPSSSAQLTCTKKVSDPLRTGVSWRSRSSSKQGNLCIHFNGTRQRFAKLGTKRGRKGEAWKPNPKFSFVPRMQFGFLFGLQSKYVKVAVCVSNHPVSPTSSAACVPVQTFLNPSRGPDE